MITVINYNEACVLPKRNYVCAFYARIMYGDSICPVCVGVQISYWLSLYQYILGTKSFVSIIAFVILCTSSGPVYRLSFISHQVLKIGWWSWLFKRFQNVLKLPLIKGIKWCAGSPFISHVFKKAYLQCRLHLKKKIMYLSNTL